MLFNLHRLSGALTPFALAGCLGSQAAQVGNGEVASPDDDRAYYGSSMVIGQDELSDRTVPLLNVLKNRVSNIRIEPSTDCPQIILRGQKRFVGPSNAQVYVNGVRSVNTCVLRSLNTADLARVEIYPGGVTMRPGYRSHPYGLIVVFTKGARIPG
ncbi:MAG TPA: Plug domain-containing protein [Longimicrobiaceae bacterium]|nr:Plug domain-containing protein [Longimicrobiaceae bacterium]